MLQTTTSSWLPLHSIPRTRKSSVNHPLTRVNDTITNRRKERYHDEPRFYSAAITVWR